MELSKLLQGINVKATNVKSTTEIRGVKINSYEVENGDLFICMKGVKDDGNAHLGEIGVDFVALTETAPDDNSIKFVQVDDARRAYSIVAQNFWLNPLDGMKFVAVVGTNGKTSTAHYLSSILAFAGFRTGLIGTEGHYILDEKVGSSLTTPDPMEMNELFFKMRTKGVEIVVSEVSAHAIALKKLDGIIADVAILTNITEDHLDFFDTFENYARAKMSYFSPEHTRLAIVNADDALGAVLARHPEVKTITYALNNPSDAFAIDVCPTLDGTEFVANINDEIYDVKCALFGGFNVYNLLAAMSAARELGVRQEVLLSAVRKIKAVQGRFSILRSEKGLVVIDYAHTPDGLKNVLETARPLTKSALVTVFGCGGDRDRQKRKIMGEVAARLSDYVVITSDNPRFEDATSIMEQIEEGVGSAPHKLIENRSEAIAFAIKAMEEGDTVVIAGKGAEDYIDVRGKKLPYSDFDAAKKWGALR